MKHLTLKRNYILTGIVLVGIGAILLLILLGLNPLSQFQVKEEIISPYFSVPYLNDDSSTHVLNSKLGEGKGIYKLDSSVLFVTTDTTQAESPTGYGYNINSRLVSKYSSNLYLVREDSGDEMWSINISGQVNNLMTNGRAILVETFDEYFHSGTAIHLINIKTGKITKIANNDPAASGKLAIHYLDDEFVIYSDNDKNFPGSTFYKYSLEKEEIVWQFQIQMGSFQGPVTWTLSDNDLLVSPHYQTEYFRLDFESGEVVWREDDEFNPLGVIDNVLYLESLLSSDDENREISIAAVDVDTGKRLWEQAIPMTRSTLRLERFQDSLILLGSHSDDPVTSLNVTTGRELWSYHQYLGYNYSEVTFNIYGDYLYKTNRNSLSDGENKTEIISLSSGEKLSEMETYKYLDSWNRFVKKEQVLLTINAAGDLIQISFDGNEVTVLTEDIIQEIEKPKYIFLTGESNDLVNIASSNKLLQFDLMDNGNIKHSKFSNQQSGNIRFINKIGGHSYILWTSNSSTHHIYRL